MRAVERRVWRGARALAANLLYGVVGGRGRGRGACDRLRAVRRPSQLLSRGAFGRARGMKFLGGGVCGCSI